MPDTAYSFDPARYEQPLPVLEVDTDGLLIETKDRYEGKLQIKNAGGGNLAGYICSRHRAITFVPSAWDANTQTITYTFNPAQADGLAPGQQLETLAYICSNGGEVALPITVRLTKMAITTREGHIIANVGDFFEYAQDNPAGARQIFVDSEFYMLLLAVGYPYMEVYESLHKDANRERAIDNFFILSGLKGKTGLKLQKRVLTFDQRPGDTAKIYGQLLFEKTDSGFCEAPIEAETAPPWLALSANRLISSDFDTENQAMVNFSIDPLQITGRYAREIVFIGHENDRMAVELIFRRPQPLMLRLVRESYRYDDKGTIEVFNHTGQELMLELFCADSYMRFAARRYVVGAFYEIPFDIKLSAFMNAGRLFRKTPYMRTAIEVKASCPGHVYKHRLPLVVGEW